MSLARFCVALILYCGLAVFVVCAGSLVQTAHGADESLECRGPGIILATANPRIRTGPSESHTAVGLMLRGTTAVVTGMDSSCKWYALAVDPVRYVSADLATWSPLPSTPTPTLVPTRSPTPSRIPDFGCYLYFDDNVSIFKPGECKLVDIQRVRTNDPPR